MSRAREFSTSNATRRVRPHPHRTQRTHVFLTTRHARQTHRQTPAHARNHPREIKSTSNAPAAIDSRRRPRGSLIHARSSSSSSSPRSRAHVKVYMRARVCIMSSPRVRSPPRARRRPLRARARDVEQSTPTHASLDRVADRPIDRPIARRLDDRTRISQRIYRVM